MENIITKLQNEENELFKAMKNGKISTSEYESALNNLVETVLRDFIQSRGGVVKKSILKQIDKNKKAKN